MQLFFAVGNKSEIDKERERETYGFGFADESSNGGGGFGEDGRGVDTFEVDVGGEVEARHRFDISLFKSLTDSVVATSFSYSPLVENPNLFITTTNRSLCYFCLENYFLTKIKHIY